MKIAIFGGTFDPPHYGHLILCEIARDELNLDQIWLTPALMPPHKKGQQITPPHMRMRMVELLCGNDPFLRPSDADIIHQRTPSYTIDLLEELSQKNCTENFSLLIGEDSLCDFTTWHRWEDILENYSVFVFPRQGVNISRAHPKVLSHVIMLKTPIIEISSTEIRNRISFGRTIRYLTTQPVREFIEQNRLYR